jgi:hypothetical protein
VPNLPQKRALIRHFATRSRTWYPSGKAEN